MYVDGGSGGDSGWIDDGAVVRLGTATDFVGIGTTNPNYILEISKASGTRLNLQATDATSNGDQTVTISGIELGTCYHNLAIGPCFNLIFKSGGNVERARIDYNGNFGIGTTTPQGKLDVNGPIYQRGNLLHADYVFKEGYKLESIDEHSQFMKQNKHLKAIPKAVVTDDGQEIVELGAHRRGMVEELEKAHIYIDQLQKRITALEEKLSKLEAKNNSKE